MSSTLKTNHFNVDAVCVIGRMNATRYKNTLLGSDWIPALLHPAVPSISDRERKKAVYTHTHKHGCKHPQV